MTESHDPDKLENEHDAAEVLGLSPGTLKAARLGHLPNSPLCRLPHVRIGRSIRYRRADLHAFIEAQTVGAAKEGA